jgi:hypothetical protein
MSPSGNSRRIMMWRSVTKGTAARGTDSRTRPTVPPALLIFGERPSRRRDCQATLNSLSLGRHLLPSGIWMHRSFVIRESDRKRGAMTIQRIGSQASQRAPVEWLEKSATTSTKEGSE